MLVMLKQHRNAKPVLIVERELKTQMVKVNVGLAIIVHLIHQSHFPLNLDFSHKDSVTRNKRLAEQVHTKMNMEQSNVNIAHVVVNALISKCVGIKFVKQEVTLNFNHRQSVPSVQLVLILMTLDLST
jgi:hypothetical protein